MSTASFANLDKLATHLRKELETKKFLLLYAYNGTGKTRLSMAFKEAGKQGDRGDTLYFNAFTEDLFTWDNDLHGDSERVLKINSSSRFFSGIEEMEMENRIRPFLHRYVDFDFSIDYLQSTISFSREVQGATIDNIKVSRGEENIFVWCFFLTIVQLVIDGAEAYSWVKYIYIDDPISSLDDNNAIAVASNLAQLLKAQNSQLKTVISSHHTLFFNVLCNELSRAKKHFLNIDKQSACYVLKETGDTPFFHHVATLTELYQAFKNYGLAPKSAANFAFLLHGFHYLKQEGTMAIVLPHGVLFRGGAEERIRRKLLEDGNIDTVIGLPANLFYSTGIPVCILVLKKCKKPDDVLFINAAEHFEKGKRQNRLLPENIDKIIDTYQFRKEEERYSRRVSMEKIEEENGYNLNISRYISTAMPEEEIDLIAVNRELLALENKIVAATEKHNEFLKELGLPPLA